MARIKVGDLDVHYDERGAGTPVVLLHGNWGCTAWWEPVLERVPAGRRAIAYDLRGRGGTAGPEGDGSFRSLAADLEGFAAALGLERFHLIGHSLGTAVAMQYGLEHGDRLRSLVLISPAWVDGMPEAFAVEAHQERLAADRAYTDAALRAITPGAPRDQRWERIVDGTRAQTIETARGAMRAHLDWRPGDALRAIRVPATVISGALDPLITPVVATRVADALGAELVLLEGVGHGPMLESPDALTALLWERLAAAERP
ncbi:MAG TPA: alpha/beta fold hydrolase [Candidatus Saccharimonadales bacterium]|nr:alpha/beta fold hydrolase [Candidatus Saccharimonadales bacterium]